MNSYKIAVISITTLLISVFVHGQGNGKSGELTQEMVMIEHLKAAIPHMKLPENVTVTVDNESGIVRVLTFLDENILIKKDSLSEVTNRQCIEIYNAVKVGKVGTKNVRIEELSIIHLYFNRYFMGFGNSILSICNFESGNIKEFEIKQLPINSTGYINASFYKCLLRFRLKANQYLAPHKDQKETLCIVNIVSDVDKDRSKESASEYKRFKSFVKSIKPYKHLMIRYESQFKRDSGKEYIFKAS